jgi:hypothetical protein
VTRKLRPFTRVQLGHDLLTSRCLTHGRVTGLPMQHGPKKARLWARLPKLETDDPAPHASGPLIHPQAAAPQDPISVGSPPEKRTFRPLIDRKRLLEPLLAAGGAHPFPPFPGPGAFQKVPVRKILSLSAI